LLHVHVVSPWHSSPLRGTPKPWRRINYRARLADRFLRLANPNPAKPRPYC
jgi:hypothetical protein